MTPGAEADDATEKAADKAKADRETLKRDYASYKSAGLFTALNTRVLHERAMYVKGEEGLALVRNILADLRAMAGKPGPNGEPLSFVEHVLCYAHHTNSAFPNLADLRVSNAAAIGQLTGVAMQVPGILHPNFNQYHTKQCWDELEAMFHLHAKSLKAGSGDWNTVPLEEPTFCDGDTLLVAAARLGSLPLIKTILCMDDPLEKKDTLKVLRSVSRHGHNVLHAASANGDQAIFDFLVKLEKDLSGSVEGASECGVPLMDAYDSMNRLPLHYACWWAHAPIVRRYKELLAPAFGPHPMEGGEVSQSRAAAQNPLPHSLLANYANFPHPTPSPHSSSP